MSKFQHRVYTSALPPVAAAASALTTALTEIHNPELLPPVPPVTEPEFVVAPSQLTFLSLAKPASGRPFGMMPMSSHRPPAGFIAFVYDNYKAYSKGKEYTISDEGVAELVSRWQRLVEDAHTATGQQVMEALLQREEELEQIGHAQALVRQKEREEHQAQRRAQLTANAEASGGGFAGAKFSFAGSGFGAANFCSFVGPDFDMSTFGRAPVVTGTTAAMAPAARVGFGVNSVSTAGGPTSTPATTETGVSVSTASASSAPTETTPKQS